MYRPMRSMAARLLVLIALAAMASPAAAIEADQASGCNERCMDAVNQCYADGGVSTIGFCIYNYQSGVCTTQICVLGPPW